MTPLCMTAIFAGLIQVRMRIFIRRQTVRGPARMPDAKQRLGRALARHIATNPSSDAALFLAHMHRA